MTLSSAYLLVSHGSRDPRPQIELQQLALLVRQQLENYSIEEKSPQYLDRRSIGSIAVANKPLFALVGTASLEAASLPLNESIVQFALQAEAARLKRLQIIPLFLSAGVHVKEDIPRQISLARQVLGNRVEIDSRPYLGSDFNLSELLAKQFTRLPARSRILLAHGSRLESSNRSCEAIAARLGAVAAYWSVSPTLTERVEALAKTGERRIAIGLYFLFAGGISEAIALQVRELERAFPYIELLLGRPLGATLELANLIVKSIQNEPEPEARLYR